MRREKVEWERRGEEKEREEAKARQTADSDSRRQRQEAQREAAERERSGSPSRQRHLHRHYLPASLSPPLAAAAALPQAAAAALLLPALDSSSSLAALLSLYTGDDAEMKRKMEGLLGKLKRLQRIREGGRTAEQRDADSGIAQSRPRSAPQATQLPIALLAPPSDTSKLPLPPIHNSGDGCQWQSG